MGNKINCNNYKYIMFVDASGDDGYVFKETSSAGSSYSFVVSCFMTTPDNFEYNKNVLENMKRAMFIKLEQEIKSTALRRHRCADKVYSEMSNLNGIAFSIIADKRLIRESKIIPGDKFYDLTLLAHNDLSGITHTFPYIALHNSDLISESDRVLIVIDNMKKREMESIRKILGDEYPSTKNFDIIFRDSKDKNFPLIQIADIISGTIRNYYEGSLPLGKHNKYCKLCSRSFIKDSRKKVMATMCQTPRVMKLFIPHINDEKFNTVLRFHYPYDNENAIGGSFIIIPVNQILYFMYISCLILKNKKRS